MKIQVPSIENNRNFLLLQRDKFIFVITKPLGGIKRLVFILNGTIDFNLNSWL